LGLKKPLKGRQKVFKGVKIFIIRGRFLKNSTDCEVLLPTGYNACYTTAMGDIKFRGHSVLTD